MIKAENDKAEKCGKSLACSKGFITRAGGTIIPHVAYEGLHNNYGFFHSPKGLLWQWKAENLEGNEKPKVCFGRATSLQYGRVSSFYSVETRAGLESLMKRIDDSVED